MRKEGSTIFFEVDVAALRDTVKASGLKQKYLAEQIGVGEKSFSNMLVGKTKIPADVFCSLCMTLDKPVEFFRRINTDTQGDA